MIVSPCFREEPVENAAERGDGKPQVRRVWARIQKSSASGTTNYVHDGDNMSEELDQNVSVLAQYTQSLGIDEPLAMYRSGAGYAYHADG